MTTFLADSDPLAMTAAEKILGPIARNFTATFEYSVNKHGVPVKRLALVGPEEVDGAVVQGAAA
jgi:hypothetical protein